MGTGHDFPGLEEVTHWDFRKCDIHPVLVGMLVDTTEGMECEQMAYEWANGALQSSMGSWTRSRQSCFCWAGYAGPEKVREGSIEVPPEIVDCGMDAARRGSGSVAGRVIGKFSSPRK